MKEKFFKMVVWLEGNESFKISRCLVGGKGEINRKERKFWINFFGSGERNKRNENVSK